MENNQGYWFVVREDQSNVIFSSNNFIRQNSQIVSGQEAHYVVDSGDKYVQIEGPDNVQEIKPENEIVSSEQKIQDTFWDLERVTLLLTLSQEHKQYAHGRELILWNKIAPVIGTSPKECKKRFWNLRRTYLRLSKWKKNGKESKWPFYDICHNFFKDFKTSLAPKPNLDWGEGKIKRLLTLYIDNMHRFYDKECLKKDVWKDIGSILGISWNNCYSKFKNLRKTYLNIKESGREGKIRWPYCSYFDKISGCNLPTMKEKWTSSKVGLLLDAYSSRMQQFSNPSMQKKVLWEEIATIVGETPEDCDRKFRNLKHSYLRIKEKPRLGKTWKYFSHFEKIWNSAPSTIIGEEEYVKKLLNYYLEKKHLFMNPSVQKKKYLWRGIASKLGLTAAQCDRKFRNLKQTYMRILHKGTNRRDVWWPYLSYFQQIFDRQTSIKHENIQMPPVVELKSIMQNLQDKKQNDIFNKLVQAVEESNAIQRERNRLLEAILKEKT